MAAKQRSLYDIADDLLALEELLLESGGDISDPALEQWLEQTTQAEEEKLDRYSQWIRDMQARAGSRREEAARLESGARSLENAVKRAKDRLLWYFRHTGKKRFSTPHFSLTRAVNGGQLAIQRLAPEDTWPEEFVEREVVVKPKLDEVRARLEAGEELPFAKLAERGEHIQIR